ncbi:serine/threonine-protein kinase [Yinghuangia soli]|uniref:non-specific serine/threonine protein kinase n=1 Tax=Yinghuangia soli TaxID=2908204 RepID=A0AA41Q3J2_9ACTN|nr:serine/threonine-protein kinase [Yinghuangia soli]MCF2530076.1 serine/threonine protein kinase [Yinghuangia soli]
MTEASGGRESRLVNGRYRLGESLGRGGMGTVWLAVDELLRREVAVKEVRIPDDLDPAEQETRRERAMREARAAARVVHPNVVTIYDVVEDGGRPWIVMELVRARSLDDVIEHEGRLGPSEAAEIGIKVLSALRAARDADVLHRDVKPSNILIGSGGRVVLTDFGIATVLGSATLTATGMLIGSPEYLAPERVLGRRPGAASDLWSLGVTLYQAVEGRSPFARGGAIETLTAVLQDEPAATRYAGALGPAIAALMRKEPDDRPDEAETELLLGAALKGKQHGTGQALAAGGHASAETALATGAGAAALGIPAPPEPSSFGGQATVEDPRGPHGLTQGPGFARTAGEGAAAGALGAGAYGAAGESSGWVPVAHEQADETRTAGAGHPRNPDTPPPFPGPAMHGAEAPVGPGGTQRMTGEAFPPRQRSRSKYVLMGGLAAAAVAAAIWAIPAAMDKDGGGGGGTGNDSGNSAGATGDSSDAGVGGVLSPATDDSNGNAGAGGSETKDDSPATKKTSPTTRPTTTHRPTNTTTKPTTTAPTTTKPTTTKPPTTTPPSSGPVVVAPAAEVAG